MNTDSQILQDVTDELEWDAALDAAQITISIENGRVTLGGKVGSYLEKWEAERAVQCIAGVKALALKIVVVPRYARADADIARAAEVAISQLAGLPMHSIQIRVKNGWLTLSGYVQWHYQRQNAASAVRYLMGVTGVSDDIMLQQVSYFDIRADIEAALKRQFDSARQNIVVSVIGQNVTLSGTVTGWWHRGLALHAARNAAGVQSVTDNLTIR